MHNSNFEFILTQNRYDTSDRLVHATCKVLSYLVANDHAYSDRIRPTARGRD